LRNLHSCDKYAVDPGKQRLIEILKNAKQSLKIKNKLWALKKILKWRIRHTFFKKMIIFLLRV
jgi:hypothetical protein